MDLELDYNEEEICIPAGSPSGSGTPNTIDGDLQQTLALMQAQVQRTCQKEQKQQKQTLEEDNWDKPFKVPRKDFHLEEELEAC